VRVKDFAELHGVHTSTVYRWIRDGKLAATRDGKPYGPSPNRQGPIRIEAPEDASRPENEAAPRLSA
jgi:excisionase family DNA binding protein